MMTSLKATNPLTGGGETFRQVKKTLEEERGSLTVSEEEASSLLATATITKRDCKQKLWRSFGVWTDETFSLEEEEIEPHHMSEQLDAE